MYGLWMAWLVLWGTYPSPSSGHQCPCPMTKISPHQIQFLLNAAGCLARVSAILAPMVSDRNIWRSANLLVNQHGSNAAIEAEARGAALEKQGDAKGVAVWRRMLAGVKQLQNTTSPTGIQEIDRFDGVCLEAGIWDAIETRFAKRPKRRSA